MCSLRFLRRVFSKLHVPALPAIPWDSCWPCHRLTVFHLWRLHLHRLLPINNLSLFSEKFPSKAEKKRLSQAGFTLATFGFCRRSTAKHSPAVLKLLRTRSRKVLRLKMFKIFCYVNGSSERRMPRRHADFLSIRVMGMVCPLFRIRCAAECIIKKDLKSFLNFRKTARKCDILYILR